MITDIEVVANACDQLTSNGLRATLAGEGLGDTRAGGVFLRLGVDSLPLSGVSSPKNIGILVMITV